VQETLVGAEFILMEKMNGLELKHFLPGMKIQDRLEVGKTIASYQKSWVSVSFEQFGSLYFAGDVGGLASSPLTYLDHEGRKLDDSRFVVGPQQDAKCSMMAEPILSSIGVHVSSEPFSVPE
jgi:hypothetical protein